MASSPKASRRLLEPQDRISEVLFGVVMALTITNSLDVAQQGQAEVRTLVAGALGCNLAWGLIDAAMYLLAQYGDRGWAVSTLRALHMQTDPAAARHIVADALPPGLASVLREEDLDTMRLRLKQSTMPAAKYQQLIAEDWLAAGGVFLLVFLSTLPLVIPFAFIGEPRVALRASNAVAVVMLFLCGFGVGRYSGNHPWRVGSAMVLLGIVMVAIAMALGG
jgi:VIT family protein